MVNLSKSKYCALWQCPKMLWLRKYKPGLAEVDSHTLSIMETGNAVGDLAMGLFGDFTEVTVYTDGEIYRREYKRRFAWIKAGRISDSQFYAWSEQAREQKKKCDEGSITAEDFQRWLKES